MRMKRQAWSTAAVLLVLAGAIALFWSAQQDRIWWVLAGFLFGMTCVSLLLLRVGDFIEDWLIDQQPRWVPLVSAAAAGVGLLGVVFVIAWQWPPVTVILSVIVMTVGFIALFQWFERPPLGGVAARSADDENAVETIGVGSATWYGFEAMAVAIGLYMIADGTATLIGAVIWLSGLVTVKIASLGWLKSRGDDLGRTMRALVDIALIGLFVLFAGAFGSSTVLVLLGLSVALAALSMIGVGAPRLECSLGKRWWAIGGSLALMLIVWIWMTLITQNPGLAFVLGLMIALVGGFFVLRGEGIVLLMLAGYVLAWGLVDRSVTIAEAAPPVADKPVQIVALGDSFISGEGASEFFQGTNEAGGNQCRRAPTAHPFLVASALDTNVLSFACSGATIDDLSTCGQMWRGGRRCRVLLESDADGLDVTADDAVSDPDAPNPLLSVWADALADDTDEPPGALPQLVSVLDHPATSAADVVLLSIGGNDVGFSSIVKACLLPKGCEERRDLWLDAIDLLGPELDQAYAQVRGAFPAAQILVMPYPMLVNAEPRTSCDLGLSQAEREFVVDFIEKLDVTISEAAGRAGFAFVDEAVGAFAAEQAQLCDKPAAANHLKLVPPAGGKLARYSPATWIPGSMHPNELGHELTAVATVCPAAVALGMAPVSGTIEDDRAFSCEEAIPPVDDGGGDVDVVDAADATAVCEEALAADGAADEDQVAACAAVAGAVDQKIDELAVEVAVVTDELVSDDEWIRVELFRTLRALALPLVLLLAAGMIFAWGLVQFDNPFSRFLSPHSRG